MYKIKRFSWEGRVSGAGIGTVVGASLANKLSRGSGKAQLIGAGLGLAGGYYLGHKLDKITDKWKARQEAREEKKREEKAANDRRYRYPTKELESEYPAIVELGGMPKEYYQMAEICKKVDSSARYPSWGDGDEYMSPSVSELEWIEDTILGNSHWKSDLSDIPLIWLGCQGECELIYDFRKNQWYDQAYHPKKRITNLKSYILKIYDTDLKSYGLTNNGTPYLDDEYIEEVKNYYTDIIKIIKYSKLG